MRETYQGVFFLFLYYPHTNRGQQWSSGWVNLLSIRNHIGEVFLMQSFDYDPFACMYCLPYMHNPSQISGHG